MACAAFFPAEATQMSSRALSAGADVACECHKPGLCVIVVERGGTSIDGKSQQDALIKYRADICIWVGFVCNGYDTNVCLINIV